MTAWATDVDAKLHWPDARTMDPDLLDDLLAIAQEDVEPFAPAPKLDLDGQPVIPRRYTLAVINQARELWAAIKRDGGVIGTEFAALRARPLVDVVKQLLRPTRGPVAR